MHASCRSALTRWRCGRRGPSLPLAMRRALTSAVLLFIATVSAAAPNASPEGYWLTASGHGIIEITRCGAGDTLCGKLAWFRVEPGDPNTQGLDLKNPNPAERSRPLCGATFMYGFKPTAPDHWEDGMVYDAESGNTYHATLMLRPDGKLELHGYIGIPLFGRSEIWTRFTAPIPSCPGR